MTQESATKEFAAQFIDLVNEKVGGRALLCSDEWFAECANLVKADEPVFKEGHFVATGQWMDGWESRRSFGRAAHRSGQRDFDWCVLRLGIPGVLRGVNIDTRHFRGNAPEFATLEGTWSETAVTADTRWFDVLPKSQTAAHSLNVFDVSCNRPCTHLRLNIYPDGGVARLRAYGEAQVLRDNFVEGELVDLASVMHGGRGVACSDMFYSLPGNLLMPGRGANMGDGWETRRRRDAEHDWSIIKLGLRGSIRKVIVDTAHFKGNYPDRFSLEAACADSQDLPVADMQWHNVIPETALYADQEHVFIRQIEVSPAEEFTHVRLHIYPDGGVSRLRVFGFPNWGSR